MPMNTAEHLPVTTADYQQLALTWKHTLGIGEIYNIRASRQQWKSIEDVLDRQLWEYQQDPNQYYDPLNRIDGPYYVTNGDYPFYERRNTVTYTLNGDYSKKVKQHNFMVGGDINYNSLSFLLTQFPERARRERQLRSDPGRIRELQPRGIVLRPGPLGVRGDGSERGASVRQLLRREPDLLGRGRRQDQDAV